MANADGPLPNGSSFMVSGDAGVTLDGFAFITNHATSAKEVLVRKYDISIINGSENFFCWGLCFGSNVFLSPDPVNVAAGATNDLDFSAHYMANMNFGISHTMYTFFSKTNPNDSVSVNIYWNAGIIGIGEQSEKFSFSNAFPNPAKNLVSFSYSLPSGKYAEAQLLIRNLLGETVKTEDLEAGKGKVQVNISDLRSGVYFYSFRLDGVTVVSRKLVVE